MALQKSKTLSNGSSGNYWKILDFSYNRIQSIITCRIALFASKAVSQSAKVHLGCVKSLSFAISPHDQTSNIPQMLYGLIKDRANSMTTRGIDGVLLSEPAVTDPDLAGATDV